ncbi:MAG: MFS transporter [Methylococcaceae bacterium]|nr:MFS transporter [Methylococcaceae bacterium]
MNSSPPSHTRPQPSLARIILVGLMGNVMEWYDFAVYGYFAMVIGDQFFPATDPAVSLIASFGAFAAGFLMRPIGGLVFGRIGDLVGRQRAMLVSVMAMAVPTVLMSLLPTYGTVGIAAPLVLVGLRIIQGLSVGGEFTSSLIFLAEHAPSGRRSLTAIWGNWGAVLGILLGSGVGLWVTEWLTEAQVQAWGWRVPFALGGLLALVAWLVRRGLHVDLPPIRSESPVRDVFTRYRGAILRVALLNVGTGVAFYTVFIYAVSYIRNIDHLTESVALELNTISMSTLLLLLPVVAWMSDRWGSRGVLTLANTLLVLLSYPLFQLIHSSDPDLILMGELGFAVLVALGTGGILVLNASLIPAPVRCTGLGFAYNASMGLFGGTTPLIAAWLIKVTDNPLAPAYWLLTAAIVSLLTLLLWVPKGHAADI